MEALWKSGNRRTPEPTVDFPEKYRTTAMYRFFLHKSTIPYSGFDNFVMLSSGITSNFMELCKYAFFHALEHKLDLGTTPEIPATLQSRAIYEVSHKQLKTVEGNVPQVGISLRTLVNDLGAILRGRLLRRPSETECNRIAVEGYDQLDAKADADFLRLIDNGITWSVFHLHGEMEAHRPKHSARPPTLEITLDPDFRSGAGDFTPVPMEDEYCGPSVVCPHGCGDARSQLQTAYGGIGCRPRDGAHQPAAGHRGQIRVNNATLPPIQAVATVVPGESDDFFITCASWEGRCLGLLDKLAGYRCRKVIIFAYKPRISSGRKTSSK